MKWKTFQHNGILFPPDFESQGIKIRIKGQLVELNLLQEEMIYQWAKKKDTGRVMHVLAGVFVVGLAPPPYIYSTTLGVFLALFGVF